MGNHAALLVTCRTARCEAIHTGTVFMLFDEVATRAAPCRTVPPAAVPPRSGALPAVRAVQPDGAGWIRPPLDQPEGLPWQPGGRCRAPGGQRQGAGLPQVRHAANRG